MIVAGLLSGTSADAIDVAAARLERDGDVVRLACLGAEALPFPEGLAEAVRAVLPPAATTTEALCRLDAALGRAFAAAARLAVEHWGAELVVSHGQTVHHLVEDGAVTGTLQLGQPAEIAEAAGVPVVADVRARDVAAGGQGAPLVSFLDVLLLAGAGEPHAALNLGGIANLTVVAPDRDPVAFDAGPANAWIDVAATWATGGARGYDAEGRIARRGNVHPRLRERLLADPYYGLPAPKTTGKERYSAAALRAAVEAAGGVPAEDVVATVTEVAAEVVARACRDVGAAVVVGSGGGMRNPVLREGIARRLRPAVLEPIERWGIDGDAKEAYAFALLGWCTWHGLPATIPSCTGARAARVLGALVPGREPLRLPEPAAGPVRRLVVDRTPAAGAPATGAPATGVSAAGARGRGVAP